MISSSYNFKRQDMLLHDGDNPDDATQIDAMVASDDCFITLATQLDALTHDEPTLTLSQQTAIEPIVRTLIYLQRQYQIVKKQPNYRQ